MDTTEGNVVSETTATPAPAGKSATPLADAQEANETARREAVEKKAAADEVLRNYTRPEEEGQEGPADDGYTPEIPGHVPQSAQYDENVQGALQELGGILRESAIAPEVGQGYVDIYAEYAMEHPATEVDPMNPGAVHAQLRSLWGETYGTRWGHVQKAWNAMSPKTQDWIADHAEHPIAMFRTLAAIGSGTFSISQEQAQAAVDKMRADKKSPLYDLSHKEHRLHRDTFRNLSLVANRQKIEAPKGLSARQGNVEEMVADRSAKEPAGDSAEGKLDAEITAIRMDKGYWNSGAANHKALVARMRELMRRRWPS
jgi:hypothetical protein